MHPFNLTLAISFVCAARRRPGRPRRARRRSTSTRSTSARRSALPGHPRAAPPFAAASFCLCREFPRRFSAGGDSCVLFLQTRVRGGAMAAPPSRTGHAARGGGEEGGQGPPAPFLCRIILLCGGVCGGLYGRLTLVTFLRRSGCSRTSARWRCPFGPPSTRSVHGRSASTVDTHAVDTQMIHTNHRPRLGRKSIHHPAHLAPCHAWCRELCTLFAADLCSARAVVRSRAV